MDLDERQFMLLPEHVKVSLLEHKTMVGWINDQNGFFKMVWDGESGLYIPSSERVDGLNKEPKEDNYFIREFRRKIDGESNGYVFQGSSVNVDGVDVATITHYAFGDVNLISSDIRHVIYKHQLSMFRVGHSNGDMYGQKRG